MSIFGNRNPPPSNPVPLDCEYEFPNQPKEALFQPWKVTDGDDSHVIKLEGDNKSLVLKIPKSFQSTEEISTQEIISQLVGPPTVFIKMNYSDEKGKHSANLTLSAQVPLFLDMLARISISNTIDESERENQLIKIFEERINVMMYTLSKGYIADFDLCNVGICEIKDKFGNSDFGVFLIDYCEAHVLSESKLTPQQFANVHMQLTEEEKRDVVNMKNSLFPNAKFMRQSHLCVFECIIMKDFLFVDALKINDSIKIKIKEFISNKYKNLLSDIANGTPIPTQKAVETKKVLEISQELLTDIEHRLSELMPDRRNISLSMIS